MVAFCQAPPTIVPYCQALPTCQAHPTNAPETIHSASLNCPVDPRIVFETETLHHLFNFTIYPTLFTCPVDPHIVFETSIRRIAMFHVGEQWVGFRLTMAGLLVHI